MKLHFENPYTDGRLEYQRAAIEAACDLFRGQQVCRTEFTVTRDALSPQQALEFAESDLGIGNRLQLLDDEVLANLSDIQVRNGLRPWPTLASGDFTIEMETGTGKTYVYLRTIFEMNRRYGFTKFVIVVPTVAIKEGVYKTLKITEDHFRSLYANTPFEYFLYDSGDLSKVRNFATGPNIQIMVVTVGAINKKDVNNLYGKGANEQTGGEKPIDLIRATRPILIVDEPQSVDGGLEGRGKEALGAMNPLCTLRYSATHAVKHHMIYRLDAVDAYEQKLVKQIEVASLEVEGGHNKAYLKLLSTSNKRGKFTAKLELDILDGVAVTRDIVTVEPGHQEKLLSFDSKLKFIFSHSALREGWDNPNVFQICALRDIGTERERRQTIGRGLRLCVNQSGDRLRGFEINTLTVVATEGYEQFAENLQKEIEQDTGIRFGIVEKHKFAAIPVTARRCAIRGDLVASEGRGLCRCQGQSARRVAEGPEGRNGQAARRLHGATAAGE